MTQSLKQPVSVAVLALALGSVPALRTAANEETTTTSSDVLVTDFRGRPPFKRERISSAKLADLARFEETEAPPTGEKAQVVDYRGRPPFKREILPADEIADLARFEETAERPETQRTRHGPPGKSSSRR